IVSQPQLVCVLDMLIDLLNRFVQSVLLCRVRANPNVNPNTNHTVCPPLSDVDNSSFSHLNVISTPMMKLQSILRSTVCPVIMLSVDNIIVVNYFGEISQDCCM